MLTVLGVLIAIVLVIVIAAVLDGANNAPEPYDDSYYFDEEYDTIA